MASALSCDNGVRQQQQLLQQPSLSPPSSPPTAKRRRKKKLDPLEELLLTPVPSPPASPLIDPARQEPFLKKIIFTPFLFISFLLSLSLVNYRDRTRRTTAPSSILTYFYPSSWLSVEPYQDPANSTWGRKDSAAHVEPNAAIGPKKDGPRRKKKTGSWHLKKKIRKMTKLEINDALEMRGRVMAVMIVVMASSGVVMWMGMRWLLARLSVLVSSGRT